MPSSFINIYNSRGLNTLPQRSALGGEAVGCHLVAVLHDPGDLGDVLDALHGPGELRAHGEPRLLLAVARVPEPGGEAEHVRGVGAVQLTARGLGAAAAPADEAVVVVGPAAADNGTVQSAG